MTTLRLSYWSFRFALLMVRTINGEKVTISGADLIEEWRREADGGWSAPLLAEPKRVLWDGQLLTEFLYDKTTRRIMVMTGGDPRLQVLETVARELGIDLDGKKDVQVDGITVVNIFRELR